MGKISRQETERIAKIAKLDVSGEGESFMEDINTMLEMLDIRLELETDSYGIPPAELVNTYREDEAKPSLARELVLLNAPEVEAGCISVPKTAGSE